MTSLIDVIFLLLLFFMLSSTFTKFSEVDLAAGAGAGGGQQLEPGTRPVFVQLSNDSMRMNGQDVDLTQLNATFEQANPVVLVSMQPDVTAQRLTDLLVAFRAVPGARLTVLKGGV